MPSKTIHGTLRFPDWCLSSFAGSRRMLEIGCGPKGGLSELAIEIGAEFCGMDINNQAVADTGNHQRGVRFVAHDARLTFPADIGIFDLVVMKAFLTCLPTRDEHIKVLRNARVHAAENAQLAVMDFLQNWDNPIYKARYDEGMSASLERGSFAAPANAFTAGYAAHHFSQDEAVGLMRESDWNIQRMETVPVVTRSGNRINGFVILALAE